MKARVNSGTEGLWSGLEEYDLNLRVGLKLRAELEARGYSVYMVRTTHDVDLSNAERAQMAAAAHADIFIRIHAKAPTAPPSGVSWPTSPPPPIVTSHPR